MSFGGRGGRITSVVVVLLALAAAAPAHAQTLTELAVLQADVVDAAPDRVLITRSRTHLAIHTIATGQESAIPMPAGRRLAAVDLGTPQRGHLIPGGAVFVTVPAPGAGGDEARLHEWRGGATTELGPLAAPTLRADGDYITWATPDGTLTRRNVVTATNTAIATGTFHNDVAANGDVVYHKDCCVYRWRNGITTLLSDPAVTSFEPLTDGGIVAFGRCCPTATAYHDGSGEHVIPDSYWTNQGKSEDAIYDVGGDWLAFMRFDEATLRNQVWTRAPDGTLAPVDPPAWMLPQEMALADIAPDGHVAFSILDTAYLGGPGIAPFPLPGPVDRVFSEQGAWYVIRDNVDVANDGALLRVEFDTAVNTATPAVTAERSAAFELASSARAATFECRLDGADWAACARIEEFASLADGVHTFQARARRDGTTVDPTPASFTWRVDGAAPEPFALHSPPDGATVYTRTPTLSWQTPTDSGSGVAYQYLFIDGQMEEQLGPHENSAIAPGLGPGTHTWRVRAVDAAGHTRDSETRSFVVADDLTPPAPFGLLAPGPEAVVGDPTPSFSWEPAGDAGSGVAAYAVRVDGVLVAETPASQTATTAVQQLSDGPHEWLVEASDGAGNERASETRRFTVDASPPVASIVPEARTMPTGDYVDFDARGSRDSVTAIARYEWDLDGDGRFETDTGLQSTVTQRFQTPGERAIAVRVSDRAGNTDATATTVQITGAEVPRGTGSLEIEDGARYTRRRSVTLRLSWPAGATAMQVSQDPGFAGAVQRPLAPRLEWTLRGSGADREPEVVHVRFLGGAGGEVTDSILLDTARPRVRMATLERESRQVRLRAHDSASGVAFVQLTADRSRPGRRIRYRRSLRARDGALPRWVRATDRAGNRSGWRRIARARR